MDSLAGLLPWFLEYGYFALFVLLFSGGIYLPLPSNVALIAAGVLSHISVDGLHFNFVIAASIAFLASVLGDIGAYYLSRTFTSKKRRAKLEKRHASYRKIEKHLRAHPVITVASTRLIGFLSPAINSLAGFSKLSFVQFVIGDVVGNAVCVILYMGVGYYAESISGNLVTLVSIGSGVLVVFAIVYVGILLFLREDKI
jgi:membrane protein DedA with SNARE-associated domain